MFEYLDQSRDDLADVLCEVEDRLLRYFDDEWLFIDCRAIHVDDVIEALQRHVAQIDRTAAAYEAWLGEEAIMRCELHYEIHPLLAAIRRFVGDEIGAERAYTMHERLDDDADDARDDDDRDDDDDDKDAERSRT